MHSTGSCAAAGNTECCDTDECLGVPGDCMCDEFCHITGDCCSDIGTVCDRGKAKFMANTTLLDLVLIKPLL